MIMNRLLKIGLNVSFFRSSFFHLARPYTEKKTVQNYFKNKNKTYISIDNSLSEYPEFYLDSNFDGYNPRNLLEPLA